MKLILLFGLLLFYVTAQAQVKPQSEEDKKEIEKIHKELEEINKQQKALEKDKKYIYALECALSHEIKATTYFLLSKDLVEINKKKIQVESVRYNEKYSGYIYNLSDGRKLMYTPSGIVISINDSQEIYLGCEKLN